MTFVWLRLCLLLLLGALLGCEGENTYATKTQVTLRIQMQDTELLARTTHVRIQLFRKDGSWVPASDTTQQVNGVRWPLDIPIVPRSAGAVSKPFEVVVEAFADDTRLAQSRVITAYAPNSLRVLEIWLYTCPGGEANRVCAPDDCHGELCETCSLSGECDPVRIVEPPELPAFIATESPSVTPPPGSTDFDAALDPDGGMTSLPMDEGGLPGVAPLAPTCAAPCGSNAECVVTGTVAACKCLTGFMDVAGACVDVNECDTNNGACGAHSTCSNTEGGRTCECEPGFERAPGAIDCTDKCAAAGCDAHATCAIVGSTAVCTCQPPYVGTDGKTCTFDESCAQLKCGANSVCEVTGTTRACKCSPGYRGDGTTCTNINECTETPTICGQNATCADTPGAHTCTCADGFQSSASGCQNINDCTATSCLNNGACIDGVKATSCNCAGTGFEGNRCQTNTNDCTATSCMNGGQCADGVSGFSCNCASVDYSGSRCETKIQDCPASNPCMNGGTCADGNRTYTCSCLAGFSGSRCETNKNDCSPNPCMNGGTCTDGANTYACSCPAGYSGSRCETNINDCPSPNPCQNSGTCVDGVNTYTCSCRSGFSGPRCEAEVCQDATIASDGDRTTYRNCSEFRNLTVAGVGVSAITSSDFPFLTRVTGNLVVTGFAAGGPSTINLTGVTFPRLVSVGGLLQLNSNTAAFLTAAFAELTSIGRLDLGFTRLRSFSAPKLTTINGNVSLNTLLDLCTFDVRRVTLVTGNTFLGSVPRMVASAFAQIRSSTRGTVTQEYVGCCFLADRVGCQDLSPADFECGCNF